MLDPTKDKVLDTAEKLTGRVGNLDPLLRQATGDEEFYNTSPLTMTRVTITSGTNKALAAVALGNAGTVAPTRHSQPERDARAELVDAIYALRIAKTWNTVEQARLYEAQAKQHLFDLRHPKQWGFEDAKFVAVWCRLRFTAADLPSEQTYVVRIAERAPTALTREDLDNNQKALDLYLD